MNNFTPELIAQVKAAKSAEELMALAKENNVELSEDEAKTYYEQLHTNGAVSDDELDAVAGGGSCPETETSIPHGTHVRVINGDTCSACGGTTGYMVCRDTGVTSSVHKYCVKCECGELLLSQVWKGYVEVI
jgi:hypothetical protein